MFLIAWVSIDSSWIRKAVTAMFWIILWLFISPYSIGWLLTLVLKQNLDGEAYFKGHLYLQDLAERETCMCTCGLWAKWFLLAGAKLQSWLLRTLCASWRQKKHFPPVCSTVLSIQHCGPMVIPLAFQCMLEQKWPVCASHLLHTTSHSSYLYLLV